MESVMSKSSCIVAAVAAAALMGLASGASAAPMSGLTGAGEALKTEAQAGGAETIGYRCWWSPHRGRVCAVTRPQVYGFHYAPRHSYGYSYSFGRSYGYGRPYGGYRRFH
jgi:hypothetical protein